MLAEIAYGRWHLGVGDPTIIGWLTVVAYFICFVTCFIAVRRHLDKNQREAVYWFLMTLIMLFLGINKQLDLQMLMGEIGRSISKSQGWYEDRKIVQITFLVLLGIFFLWAGHFTWRRFDKVLLRNKLASFGLFYLCAFIMVRAISIHGTDSFMDSKLFGGKLSHLLEIAGVILIMWGASVNRKPEILDEETQTAAD